MPTWKASRHAVAWCLVLLMALPPPLFAQAGKADAGSAPRTFSQAELDQMLAPIALYPDSLLAQVLIAATYPLEVVMAERWARENRHLPSDQWHAALAKQPWDASVKALVPFPDVLEMMSRNLDWTHKVGDAFLAQQADVMDTVQRLRKRAHDAGNLTSTAQQKVIVEGEIIRVEPTSPSVIYVPVYDPWWVFGPWWWPAFPPFVLWPFPAAVAVAPGLIWFGVGVTVGAFWWGTGWGYWGWRQRTCFVSVHRNVWVRGGHPGSGPGAVGGAWATRQQGAAGAVGTAAAVEPWRHDPAHRRGVAYRDTATMEKYGQVNRAAAESRRGFRGHEGNRLEQGTGRPAGTGSAPMVARTTARPDASAVRDALAAREARSGAPIARKGRSETPNAGNPGYDGSLRSDAAAGRAAGPGTMVSRGGRADRDGRREAGLSRPGAESRAADRAGLDRSQTGRAFEGIGRGGEVRRQSTWGRESLNAPRAGGAWSAEAARRLPQGGAAAGEALRGVPRGGGAAGGAFRGLPQGGAVRGFPQGGGGGGFRGSGGGFGGAHR